MRGLIIAAISLLIGCAGTDYRGQNLNSVIAERGMPNTPMRKEGEINVYTWKYSGNYASQSDCYLTVKADVQGLILDQSYACD